MTIPCQTCEMHASCKRDEHCYRPQTLEHWIKEMKGATEALQAAARRLDVATVGMAAAFERERPQ